MSLKQCLVVVLYLSALSLCAQSAPRKPAPKTNAVRHFDASTLKQFVKDYKYVVVLRNSPHTKKGKRTAKWYFEVAALHDVNQVFFLQVWHPQTQKKRSRRPRVDMYVYGFRKQYHGDLQADSLHTWIADIVGAQPTHVTSVAQIDAVDSHYFVLIGEAWLAANRTHMTVLAKLVSPLHIYYGLDRAETDRLTNNKTPAAPLWVYREYGREAVEVDIHLPLHRKADFILHNEFPAFVLPSPESYRLVTEYRAPVLLYFTAHADDEFVDVVRQIARPHRDYLLTMAVVPDKKNRAARFFADFLGVDRLPALRILNMQEDVRRYMYMGELQPSLIEYFLQNYRRDNLKPYALNEPLRRADGVGNLAKANHELFQGLLRHRADANLIYVYSTYAGRSREHLETLEIVQSVFRANKNFRVYVVDQDKNDLDGHFRSKLPVLLLTVPPRSVHHFEHQFDFTSIANFIISKLPHMQLSEPEFDTDEL